MALTVIDKAKELLEKEGKGKAIAFFEERIKDIGNPKNFQEVCNIAGNKTAIKWIKDQIG